MHQEKCRLYKRILEKQSRGPAIKGWSLFLYTSDKQPADSGSHKAACYAFILNWFLQRPQVTVTSPTLCGRRSQLWQLGHLKYLYSFLF